MIIGHLGPALAARARWPRLSLPLVVGASFAPDLLRLAFDAGGVGWRSANEYSHLLPWSALLGLAVGVAAFAPRRDRVAGLVAAALVASHVALDMISGHKPLWREGPTGLGVEAYQQLELLLEGALAWWGWRAARRTRSPAWVGSVATLVFLLVAQGVYLRQTFEARPYATRCVEYPLRPCWIRRRDPPPTAPTAAAPPTITREIDR
jgi:hypothetical protein